MVRGKKGTAMSDAIRKRAAARAWVTRSAKALAVECTRQWGATAVDRVGLTDAMEDFDKRWEALEAAQTYVELSLEADGLEADIEVASEFRLKPAAHCRDFERLPS